jgi:GntR family transcriptional regulator / MocR family aminotransferase
MLTSHVKHGTKASNCFIPGRINSSRGGKIAGISPFFPAVKARPFRHGLAALDAFPLKLWTQLAGKRLRKLPRELLGYGDPKGYRPLREEIASYLGTARAVRCEPEQVVIVAGSQQNLPGGPRPARSR